MRKEVNCREVEIACTMYNCMYRRIRKNNTFEEPKEAHMHGVQAEDQQDMRLRRVAD